MSMKKYFVYIDDGFDIFKVLVLAQNRKSAIAKCKRYGKILTIDDLTADYSINLKEVSDALTKSGFNPIEIDFVVTALRNFVTA